MFGSFCWAHWLIIIKCFPVRWSLPAGPISPEHLSSLHFHGLSSVPRGNWTGTSSQNRPQWPVTCNKHVRDSPADGSSMRGLCSAQSSACWREITCWFRAASCSYLTSVFSKTPRISSSAASSRWPTNTRSSCSRDMSAHCCCYLLLLTAANCSLG